MGFPQIFYNLWDHCQFQNSSQTFRAAQEQGGRQGGQVQYLWRRSSCQEVPEADMAAKPCEVEETARIPREGAGGVSYSLSVQ